MARFPHFLKPNAKSETVQHAVWFDTETKERRVNNDEISHHLNFGWAAYRRRLRRGKWSAPQWFRFEDKSDFARWVAGLCRPRTRLYTFCHNTSFDLPVLDVFTEFTALGWQLKRAVIDAPPTILTWKRERATITMLDTLNIWRMPLVKIGDQIGLPKLTMPSPDASKEEWDRYGKRDVEVIMAACLQWWDMLVDNDLGGFASTLASQAMRTYRHAFMEHDILIDDHTAALSLSRSAYLGGRNECLHLGELDGPLYLLDVNSMYPAVMQSEEYPTAIKAYTATASPGDLERWLKDYAVVADVLVETDRPYYGVKHDDKLVFPVGRFRVALTSCDLRLALGRGDVRSVRAAAIYHRAPIFRAFVTRLYDMRLRAIRGGDHVLAWQLKILMNSLYGKWGQRGMVWHEDGAADDLTARKWVELDAETGIVTHWRQLGGLLQYKQDAPEARESFPAIAAHVTANARRLEWGYVEHAGVDNTFYLDTDSLLVNQAGYDNLAGFINPERLGALKLEGTYDRATIRGPKDYTFGEKHRVKGVRKTAVWVDGSTVQQARWSSLRGLLSTGGLTAPTTRTITKHLRRVYDKGLVGPDGRVAPLCFINGLGTGGNRRSDEGLV